MNFKISLSLKITIVFLFSFILLVFTLFSFLKTQQSTLYEEIAKQYEKHSRYFKQNRFHKDEIIKYLSSLNFHQVDNPHSILREVEHPIIRKRGLELIVTNNNYYFHVLTPHFRVLFEDKNKHKSINNIHLILFGLILLLMFTIYLLILKNIKDTNLLLNSRQLFLRTVMHELKTPIAKGKIVSELIEDEKQKTRMSHIFDKLNFLINDFAKVEEIVSKNFTTNLQAYSISETLKYSYEMLMIDTTNNSITENIDKDITIKVDLNLIAMAFKNLIDNGLKYSLNHKLTIKLKNNSLFFISTGAKLPKPLYHYFKPFHNDTTAKNHGMGLGLYIVNSILEIHKFKLIYTYKDNQNIFQVSFD